MEPGVVLDERFEVERHAASGGMGQVFRALDRQTERTVAVKTFDGNRAFFSERFARESQILAELRHPRIVSFVARGLTPERRPFLVMEWVDGTSLQDIVRARRLTLEETVTVARHVAEALGAVHRRGIIHRDLKPGNLIVLEADEDWQVKVLDFGLAALASDLASTTLQGTPAYMSPELAQRQTIGAATDIFSLGCVLYECLTQTPAFFGPEPSAALSKIVASQPESLRRIRPSTPPRLTRLVEAMLAKAPQDRPSADAILAELGTLDLSPFDEPSGARGVTLDEQRIASVLVVRDPRGTEIASRLHRTQLQSMGFSLRVLVDGTIIGILETPTPPLPSALRGLRAAVELSNLFPEARVTVGMGQVRRGQDLPLASVMDAAFDRLKDTPEGMVSADESIALLAVDRYEITGRGAIWIIEGERPPAEEPRPVLGRVTPLLGRDTELEALQVSFRHTMAEGRARFHLLLGDEGSGKSRILWAAAAEPQRRGARVLRLRGEVGRGESQGLWLRGLKEHLGLLHRSDEAAWAEALGGAGHPSEAAAMFSGTQRMGAEELHALLVGWFAAAGPWAVVIDDLHHADAASLETLRFLLRRLHDRPFWVLAAGATTLERAFEASPSASDPEITLLPPLSTEASHQLVETILGEACDPGTRKRVVERAQGNPFVLEELVRAVARGEGNQLPQSVLVLAQSRLQSAPPEARRVLRAASVFGRRFWRGGASALTGMAPDELDAVLNRLLADEFVRRVRPSMEGSEVEFAIRHAVIREAAYASLPREERVAAHARAAEYLETNDGASRDVARHFEAAGLPERAVPHLRRAAQAALQAHDFDAALETAARGTRHARGEDLGELGLVQAEVRALRGEFDAADEAAELALASTSPGSQAWVRALTVRTRAAGQRGDADKARDGLQRLDGLALGPSADAAICLAEVLVAFLCTGELEAARAVEARFPELEVQEALPHRALAQLERAKATCARYRGLVATALHHHEQAADHFRNAGDVRWTCAAMGEAGQDRLSLGDLGGAQRTLEAAREEARAIGLPHVEAVLSCRIGHAAAREGQLEAAEDEIARATRSFVALGDARSEGVARFYMATVQRLLRKPELARQESERALSLLERFPSLLPTARAVHARILLEFDEGEAALRSAQLAYEALEAGRLVEEGDMYIYLVLARVLDAMNDWSRRDEILWSARTLLLRRADLIEQPNVRTSFLVKVPEHARILALARRLD